MSLPFSVDYSNVKAMTQIDWIAAIVSIGTILIIAAFLIKTSFEDNARSENG